MEAIYFAGIAGWVASAWKWAHWHRFVEFRASIYAVIIGDLLYNVLTEGRRLWTFESPVFNFTHNIIDVTIAFICLPCAIMLFLSHYPERGKGIKLLYMGGWVAFFCTHEWVASWLGAFAYHHGWNLWWSIFINSLMFPFVRLHQQKPVWAVLAFVFFTLLFSVLFRLPILFE